MSLSELLFAQAKKQWRAGSRAELFGLRMSSLQRSQVQDKQDRDAREKDVDRIHDERASS